MRLHSVEVSPTKGGNLHVADRVCQQHTLRTAHIFPRSTEWLRRTLYFAQGQASFNSFLCPKRKVSSQCNHICHISHTSANVKTSSLTLFLLLVSVKNSEHSQTHHMSEQMAQESWTRMTGKKSSYYGRRWAELVSEILVLVTKKRWKTNANRAAL